MNSSPVEIKKMNTKRGSYIYIYIYVQLPVNIVSIARHTSKKQETLI